MQSQNLLQISCSTTKPLSFGIRIKNTPLKYWLQKLLHRLPEDLALSRSGYSETFWSGSSFRIPYLKHLIAYAMAITLTIVIDLLNNLQVMQKNKMTNENCWSPQTSLFTCFQPTARSFDINIRVNEFSKYCLLLKKQNIFFSYELCFEPL